MMDVCAAALAYIALFYLGLSCFLGIPSKRILEHQKSEPQQSMQYLFMTKECPLVQEFKCPFVEKEQSSVVSCSKNSDYCWVRELPMLLQHHSGSEQFLFLYDPQKRVLSEKVALHAKDHKQCNLTLKFADERHNREKQCHNQALITKLVKKRQNKQ